MLNSLLLFQQVALSLSKPQASQQVSDSYGLITMIHDRHRNQGGKGGLAPWIINEDKCKAIFLL